MFLHGFCFNKFSNKKRFLGCACIFSAESLQNYQKKMMHSGVNNGISGNRIFRSGLVGLLTFLNNL